MRMIFKSFLVIFMSTSVMGADTEAIPADLLQLDHQRCFKGCVSDFGEKTCKTLCDCTVNSFKEKLNFGQYLALSAELSKGEVSDPTRALLDSIANQCASNIEKSGMEIGSPKPKKGKEK